MTIHHDPAPNAVDPTTAELYAYVVDVRDHLAGFLADVRRWRDDDMNAESERACDRPPAIEADSEPPF